MDTSFSCPSNVGLSNYIVEYTASAEEEMAPEKRVMAAWVNSYPDLESEDPSQEDPAHLYDEVKQDLSSSATEDFVGTVPTGYSVPTHPPRYRNSVSEALRALSLQGGTNSETPPLERAVSPPPDYHNLPSPLHSTLSGPGEGVTQHPQVENAYDTPPVRFKRVEL